MIKFRFMLLSLAIVTALMAVLIGNNRGQLSAPDQLMVRPLEMTIALPPPPPPSRASEVLPQQAPQLDLRLKGAGASLTLSRLQLKVSPPQLMPPKINQVIPDFEATNFAIDISGFSLNDLDGKPRLLTPLDIKFTPAMRRAGIKRVALKLHVVIDQTGRVHLKEVINNPYPGLNYSLKQLTMRTRFTLPTRHGKPVNTEFIWPLTLKE